MREKTGDTLPCFLIKPHAFNKSKRKKKIFLKKTKKKNKNQEPISSESYYYYFIILFYKNKMLHNRRGCIENLKFYIIILLERII